MCTFVFGSMPPAMVAELEIPLTVVRLNCRTTARTCSGDIGEPSWNNIIAIADLEGHKGRLDHRPTGPAGATGAQGPAGPQGPAGADGTSFTILGSLNNESELPGSGNTLGDAYLISGNLFVWDGSAWNNAETFRASRPNRSGRSARCDRSRGADRCNWRLGLQASSATGPAGADGRPVEMNASATHIEYRYVGDVSWIPIIAFSAFDIDEVVTAGALTGPAPTNAQLGGDTSNRRLSLNVGGTWSYVTSDNVSITDGDLVTPGNPLISDVLAFRSANNIYGPTIIRYHGSGSSSDPDYAWFVGDDNTVSLIKKPAAGFWRDTLASPRRRIPFVSGDLGKPIQANALYSPFTAQLIRGNSAANRRCEYRRSGGDPETTSTSRTHCSGRAFRFTTCSTGIQ